MAMVTQGDIDMVIEKISNVYDCLNGHETNLIHEIEQKMKTQKGLLHVDLSECTPPTYFGSHYVDALQKSESWHEHRFKRITSSRISSLLG